MYHPIFLLSLIIIFHVVTSLRYVHLMNPKNTHINRKKPEKMFLGGKGGLCLPISATIIFNRPENGAWVFSPPKYLVRDRKVSPIRHIMPQNMIAKCRKMPQNAAKRRKMPQNAAKRRK
jgi:hypothetical protein